MYNKQKQVENLSLGKGEMRGAFIDFYIVYFKKNIAIKKLSFEKWKESPQNS